LPPPRRLLRCRSGKIPNTNILKERKIDYFEQIRKIMKDNKFDYKTHSRPNKKFDGGFKEFVEKTENPSQTTIDKISIKDKGESFSLFGLINDARNDHETTMYNIKQQKRLLTTL
jgi:hypothetical protein